MRKSLLLLLAAAVLIAVPAGNAIAQNKDDVAILKCRESNGQGEPGNVLGNRPAVMQFQATFDTPPECVDTGTTVADQRACAPCLQTLIRDFACEGGREFTSNVVVDQQSNPAVVTGGSRSINKYTFACKAPGKK